MEKTMENWQCFGDKEVICFVHIFLSKMAGKAIVFITFSD
jgi:hypothetical protein